MTPMRTPYILVVAIAAGVISACAPVTPDLAAERAALLQMHEEQRRAHLEKNAALLTATFADTFRSVSRGRVSIPDKAANTVRMQDYLDASTFQEWDDISPPVIRISPDAQMAYVIVEKRVRLTAADSSGRTVPEHTVYAWMSTYEKHGGTWRLTAVASTDRPGEANPATRP